MPITHALCNSFKRELLAMAPHRAEDEYRLALFASAATLNKATTQYSPDNEVTASGTYVAGGQSLIGLSVQLDGDTAILDWATDPAWEDATIAAAGGLIYNATRENRAVAVLSFGGIIRSTNDRFRVTLPAPTADAALIRIR